MPRRSVLLNILAPVLALSACSNLAALTGGNADDSGADSPSGMDAGLDSGGSTISLVSPFVGTWSLQGTVTLANCDDGSPDSTTPTLRQATFTPGILSPALINTGCSCTFQLVVSSPYNAVLAMTQDCAFTECGTHYDQNISKYDWTVNPDGKTADVEENGTDIFGTGSSAVKCDLSRTEKATRIDAATATCGCGDN